MCKLFPNSRSSKLLKFQRSDEIIYLPMNQLKNAKPERYVSTGRNAL